MKCSNCKIPINEKNKSPYNYDLCKYCDNEVYEKVMKNVKNKVFIKAYTDFLKVQNKNKNISPLLSEIIVEKIINDAINKGNFTREQLEIQENFKIKELSKLEKEKMLGFIKGNDWYYFPFRFKVNILDMLDPLIWSGNVYFDKYRFEDKELDIFKGLRKTLDLTLSFEGGRWFRLFCMPFDGLTLPPQQKYAKKSGVVINNYYYDGFKVKKG